MAYTTINDPTIYFNTVLYTGTGSSQNITGVGFQPDWVITKLRSTSSQHMVFDSVRGVQNYLETNTDDAEATDSNTLTAFGADGFTVGSSGQMNGNNDTAVAWSWKSGSAFSNSAGANGASIASSGIASSASGMSIFTFTSTGSQSTIAHGLGATPDYYIIKKRGTSSGHWFLYTTAIDGTLDRFLLNLTSVKGDDSNTVPSSTIITSDNGSNGNTMICYAFKTHKGFSRVGSYKGNGSANGTHIHLGFKPAWLLTKDASGARDWNLVDNKRNPHNVMDRRLFPNNDDSENTESSVVDFTSNGFKIRNTTSGYNVDGNTYLYIAFAESPFVNSNGVPNNAK